MTSDSGIREDAKPQGRKLVSQQRSAFINHLPTELLITIFKLVLSSFWEERYMRQMKTLGAVSPHWKSIISSCATILLFINIYDQSTAVSIRKELTWSSVQSLDIRFCSETYCLSYHELSRILNALLSMHSCWVKLDIKMMNHDCTLPIVERLDAKKFPSLQHIIIKGYISSFPHFLQPRQAPVLEYLALRIVDVVRDLELPPSLKTLKLAVASLGNIPVALVPLVNLTRLKLSMQRDDWECASQPLHLPALRSLLLNLDNPERLLKIMVVPALNRLYYVLPSKHANNNVFRMFHAGTINNIRLPLDESAESVDHFGECIKSNPHFLRHVEPFLYGNGLIPKGLRKVCM